MVYDLQAVRDNLRNRDGERVFYLGQEDQLSWEARNFLRREKIPVLPASEAKPARYRLLTGGYMEEKPEHMTHLSGDILVEKTHPRIRFRGEVDLLEAELLLAMQAMPQLQPSLEAVLQLARQVLRCEVLDTPLESVSLGGLDAQALRKRSHFPQDFYGIPHFMPEPADSRELLQLNRLRALVRKTELAAAAAVPERTDILQALNRMSSFLYILMLQEKSK